MKLLLDLSLIYKRRIGATSALTFEVDTPGFRSRYADSFSELRGKDILARKSKVVRETTLFQGDVHNSRTFDTRSLHAGVFSIC